MTLEKPYLEVPGTTIFDAEQSAKGYHLNQFCMSLMRPENRERFVADQRAYLDEWELSEEQKQAVLDLDLNECIRLGGNIYFLSKIGATFGLSFQQMAGSMTGMSEAEYRAMMLAGGRSIEGNRIADHVRDAASRAARPASTEHPVVTASVYTSHVPAIGVAMDHGKTEEPYWKKVFDGYEESRRWIAQDPPDVVILVYNDHATAFDLTLIPTFTIGTGAHYGVADEGYGPRPVPPVEGHPELAAHLAQSLILEDFDLTLCNEMDVDHGLTVPLSLLFGDVDAWPCKVIPFAVNVVQYPVPSGRRCFQLGQALARALRTYDESAARPGVGHRRHEPPAAGPAGRTDQPRVGHGLPRPDHRRPHRARGGAAPRVRRGGRIRGHRARHVAHRAWCDGRPRRHRRRRGEAPLLPRARVQHGRRAPCPREPPARPG